jgi:hypothetical protein
VGAALSANVDASTKAQTCWTIPAARVKREFGNELISDPANRDWPKKTEKRQDAAVKSRRLFMSGSLKWNNLSRQGFELLISAETRNQGRN